MLVRNGRGKRNYRVSDAQPISPRILTEGQVTEAELSQRYAQYNSEEDWRKGIGGITHRQDLGKLASATMIDTSERGILRPARYTNASTVDSVPTEYVPSGFAAAGYEVHAFIGRYPYIWDWVNKNFDRQSALVDAARVYRNAINFDGNMYAPSWADDTNADVPVNYIHKTPAATTWTLVSGADSTNLDSFKYFAVADGKLWGGNCVHWADSGIDYEAAPQIDTVGSGGEVTNGSSYTGSFSAGTGENRCLVVGVTFFDGGGVADPTGITYNGVALTKVVSQENPANTMNVTVWRLVAPATGSNSLVVTFGATYAKAAIEVYGLSNVDQTTPIEDTSADSTDSGTSLSAGVTSTDNDLVIDFKVCAGTSPSEGALQTNRIAVSGSVEHHSSVEEATGTTTTMSWTWTGASAGVLIGASINPAASISATDTVITMTGTPSSQFAVNDVVRVDAEYMLVTAVNDLDFSDYGHAHLVVTRAYRGTAGATHTAAKNIYEATTNVHHVHSTTDGTSLAGWSTATAVGDTSSPIVALVGVDTDLLVCKTDNVYRLEADGTVTALLESTRYAPHTDQFRAAYYWAEKNIILLPTHGGGLLAMDAVSFTVTDVSFTLTMPEITTLHGQMVAFTSSYDKLYCLVHESANTRYHLLMATYTAEEGFAWHHITQLSYTTGTDAYHAALFLEAITDDGTGDEHHRVWVGIESTGSNLLPYWIPHDSHDVDASFTNDSNAVAQMVKIDAGLPQVEKTWASVDFETRNLGAAGRQFAIEHRLDGGSWLTTLTDAAGNADGILDTSNNQTLTFPDYTTGKVLELRAKPAATGQTTTASEIRHVRVTYQLRPTALKVLPVSVYLADRQRMLNGATTRLSAAAQLSQLETWNNQTAEVTVTDLRGTSRTMQFLPGSLRINEIANEANRHPEYEVSFLLASV